MIEEYVGKIKLYDKESEKLQLNFDKYKNIEMGMMEELLIDK